MEQLQQRNIRNIKKEHFISQKEQIGILRIMFWNIQPKIWNKQVQVKEQFYKGGFLRNNSIVFAHMRQKSICMYFSFVPQINSQLYN